MKNVTAFILVLLLCSLFNSAFGTTRKIDTPNSDTALQNTVQQVEYTVLDIKFTSPTGFYAIQNDQNALILSNGDDARIRATITDTEGLSNATAAQMMAYELSVQGIQFDINAEIRGVPYIDFTFADNNDSYYGKAAMLIDHETNTGYRFLYIRRQALTDKDYDNWDFLLNSIYAPTILIQTLEKSESSSDDESPIIYETLQKGDKGENVKLLQEALIFLGYLDDSADGSFGPKTEKAVENYQKAKGLPVTKIADHPTLSSIFMDEASAKGNDQENANALTETSSPEPTVDPTAEPEPTVDPTPEPALELTPGSTVMPASKPDQAIKMSKATTKPTIKPTTKSTSKPTSMPTAKPTNDWLEEYARKGIDVIKVPADVLYEYGSTFVGKTVVTAINVEVKTTNLLKASTDNNDTYSYSIIAEFSIPSELNTIKENSIAIIIGTVEEMNGINILGSGKTVDLKDCHIVTNGITTSEINAAGNEQVSTSKAEITAAEEAKAKAEAYEIQAYMDNCEVVSYEEVERNPNQYKGKLIKVTGKVEQVSEGWFNSVTMRVDQGSGKMWYITYTRSDENEPRILENDNLTFYGECDGIETYTSIVGNQVSIPALNAKYYK